MSARPRLAVFFATSGHSGVDRGLSHLIPGLLQRNIAVDLLTIQGHGPNLQLDSPHFRQIPLKTSHVYSALPGLVRYLRRERPSAIFTGKDRVNRTAAVAHLLAGGECHLLLRMGTHLGTSLAHRGLGERIATTLSLRLLYRRASKVIASSEGVAVDLRQRARLPSERVAAVPFPAIPAELLTEARARPAHPWFHDQGPPIVLGVGELSSRKGFDLLLHAFARLRQQRPVRLMILGEGEQRRSLEQLVEKLGIAENTALPGFVADVYGFMAHADAFALPSRWEGLGLALIEALALGTPATATDCPSGPAEILQDGAVGPLVPVDDVERLTAALGQLLDDPPDTVTLRAAAERYEIQRCCDRFVEAIGLPRPADLSSGQ
jgi:glycosyltransferase involved in cell wall biosynthesis